MPTRPSAQERLDLLLHHQAALAKVAREIGPAEDLERVLVVALDAMRELVAFKGGSICLVDDGMIRIAAAHPRVSPEVAALRLPVGSGLAGRIVTTGEPVVSEDLDRDPRVDPAVRHLGSNASMRSYVGVPLVCLGRVIGLLQVDSAAPDAFDNDDVRVLEGLATQVAGAIESARRFRSMVELESLKNEFIARVSHELRTPVTIVAGFTQTLLRHDQVLSEADRRFMLERTERAVVRLQHLIEELLTVATLEAGMVPAAPRVVPLSTVVDEIRGELGTARVRFSGEVGTLLVDPHLLRRALTILVDNAIKYGGDAEVSSRRDDDEVWIDVRDHGPGVPAGMQGRIFDRFVRADDRTPGIGLGLPMATAFARAMGATLELVMPPDGGAIFRLRFPAAAAALPIPAGS